MPHFVQISQIFTAVIMKDETGYWQLTKCARVFWTHVISYDPCHGSGGSTNSSFSNIRGNN